MVTPMYRGKTLSDLLEAGRAIRPQIFEELFGFVDNVGEILGSCDVGAIYEAITGLTSVPDLFMTTKAENDICWYVGSTLPDGNRTKDLLLALEGRNDSGKPTSENVKWLRAQGL